MVIFVYFRPSQDVQVSVFSFRLFFVYLPLTFCENRDIEFIGEFGVLFSFDYFCWCTPGCFTFLNIFLVVMPVLVTGIHAFCTIVSWMAGSCPAVTGEVFHIFTMAK